MKYMKYITTHDILFFHSYNNTLDIVSIMISNKFSVVCNTSDEVRGRSPDSSYLSVIILFYYSTDWLCVWKNKHDQSLKKIQM